MVSPLWKACSDGDLDKVLFLLNDASTVDIELKDHTGSTPLIEAVKNGHVEVVRALLSKGADPSNASSQGMPEQYTSDPALLELLKSAQNTVSDLSNENSYGQNLSQESDKTFYAPAPAPPGNYTYYPTINPSLSTMGEGGVYYPPPPPPQQQQQPQPIDESNSPGSGLGHLPPPEVARLIPCRYFPACRYGPQCMFAHPQSPYYQPGTAPPPPPPGQYPIFDPALGNPYGYYPPPPPPSFQQPNGAPMTPLSPPPPQPHMMHGRSPSEIVSPSQGHFANGAPPPGPYGPLSPNSYPHPGQVPVPMSVPSLPPLHHQQPPPPPGPQSPTAMYHNPPIVSPFPGPDGPGPYMPPPPPAGMGYPDMDGPGKLPVIPNGHGQPDAYGTHPMHRDGNGHRRGGMPRRGSFAGRKPPCLFFPSGRCKNGDDCRFPHILPDNSGPSHPHSYFSPRGGAPRPRGHMHGNGLATLEQKMGNLTVRDEVVRPQNGVPEDPSQSQPADPANRPRYPQGVKQQYAANYNGNNVKRPAYTAPRPQRVPSADDFPVLPGSITPPHRNGTNGVTVNGNSHAGPTAAQVLQAPPPPRKESSKESASTSTRGPSPELVRTPEESKAELAKVIPVTDQSQQQQQPQAPPTQKLPVSFAAAAAAAAATHDIPKEVSVSA